jgi:Gpi18-like mannosyltransferase
MIIAMPVAARDDTRLAGAIPYLRVLAIWFVSRAVVVLGVEFGKIYILYNEGNWDPGPRWYHRLLRWDSEWYNSVASQGYSFNGDASLLQNVAFYPLFPLLARGLASITGLPTTDALLIVANLAALAAILLLFKLVRDEFGDRIALLTVTLLSFFPQSLFLSAGYTEALALLCVVGFFLMLRRQRFFAAAVLAGLATATRTSGVTLLPVLLWVLWEHREFKLFVRDAVPLALLSTAGLWLYMLYLGVAFGHPLAFADAQATFLGGITLPQRLIAALTLQPIRNLSLMEPTPYAFDQWIFLIAIVLIIRAWFVLDFAMTLFAAVVLLLPYLTHSGGPQGMLAMGRYNLVSFPLFIVAAGLLDRTPWLTPAIVGMLGGLLFFYAALFSQWQWVG